MPLPVLLAHKLMKVMSEDRKSGKCTWLRPDSKSQVSLAYDGNTPKEVTAVVISTQHSTNANQKSITDAFAKSSRQALGSWWRRDVTLFVNPTGDFSRRPVGRRRRHRPQDHCRQLRRRRAAWRRRVQR